MRWKRIGLAGFLAPALGGCHTALPTARELITDKITVSHEAAITHELRQDAKAAWREVRCQYPRKMFSPEFHEGFLDGYTDYLDRGGSGSLPAVPPAHLTRSKRYYTPEGQARLKDYFLGFQYGTDVAIATGCRQFLTVPVLLPQKDSGAPSFAVQPPAVSIPNAVEAVPLPSGEVNAEPKPKPLPTPRPMPAPTAAVPTPMPVPVPTGPRPPMPAPPSGDGDTKFGPVPPARSAPDITLPPQNPQLPIPFRPITAPLDSDPDAPLDSKFDTKPAIRLPEPPAEVPNLPEGVPTPPVKDDLPVIAPNHGMPAGLPANHSLPK